MPMVGITDQVQWPDSCNLNWYRGGKDSVAWHADSEDLLALTHTDERGRRKVRRERTEAMHVMVLLGPDLLEKDGAAPARVGAALARQETAAWGAWRPRPSEMNATPPGGVRGPHLR